MQNIFIYLFSFLVEAIILWQYASALFVSKYSNKIKIIVLSNLYLVLFATSLLEINWLNMLLYLLFNFIFLVTQHKIKWYYALFHCAILAALMGMCELMVYSIIERFTPHFFAQVGYFQNTIIFIIFSKMTFFTIVYILIHFLKDRRQYSQGPDKSILLLVCIPLSTVFIMLTFVYVSDTHTLSPTLSWMISLSSVFLLTTNLLVFGINQYNQKKSLEITEMRLLLQKEVDSMEYYQLLLSQNENQSILIHDIKKHLQSISLLNEKNETDKINAYINQLMHSTDLQETSRLCDHDMLNAILSRYKRQCSSQHIAFLTDIRHGTTEFISDTDLTSLFCNLLDNAIEATSGIPEAFIELNISQREKTPFAIITIINSSRTNPLSGENNTLITSKPDKRNHGFGIKSIRKVVNNYHGDLQMYYENKDSTFHTIITLKK